MKIDVEKLINQVSKHPAIYNPDHKDFANKEIRENIFNTQISREMNDIKGEILQSKWEQVLNKYASFIRKLSNDDSSETVLERFMEWPWTKHMRIFKPYVRKQFQIPEFQPAVQIPEMDPGDLPDIPLLIPEFVIPLPVPPTMSDPPRSTPTPRPEFPRAIPVPRPEFPHPLSMPRPEFSRAMPRPGLPRPVPAPRQEFSHPLSMPGSDYSRSTPAPEFGHRIPGPRPAYAHSMQRIEFIRRRVPDFGYGGMAAAVPELAHGIPIMHRMEIPPFIENMFGAPDRFHSIAAMMGLDQPTDDDDDETDDNDDTDDGTGTDNETADGQSAAKKSRKEDGTSDGAENNVAEDNNGADGDSAIDDLSNHPNNNNRDVLPNLPPPKPVAERRPGEFTAQEHTFLAWAKTMSTFTAKRQATIKMKINKIMSEAEFEDLDDEFFAANTPPRRPIYTSRR